MMKKIIIAIEAVALVGGVALLQGCFEDYSDPGYGYYGYNSYPAYGYESGPTIIEREPTVIYRDAEPSHHWWQHEAREERQENRAERRERREHDRD